MALPYAIASLTRAPYSGFCAAANIREGLVVASAGLSAAILENSPVSATTRVPRINEVNGKDYFFIDDVEFEKRISESHFLEWAQFAGAKYGTPREGVEHALLEGHNVLLEIEIEGAKQVKSHMPEAVLVFLSPPSWEDLVSRLEGRGTDSPERRTERLALAQQELAAAPSFDLVIVNTSVKEVVDQLVSLVSA